MTLCWILQLAVLMLFHVQVSISTGHIEIHFLQYSDNCREDQGLNACDPYFAFCLTRPVRRTSMRDYCHYASGKTNGRYNNANFLDFEHWSSLHSLPNPWRVQVKRFEDPEILFVVEVYDHDRWTRDDHMHTWGIALSEKVWLSRQEARWAERVMSVNGGHNPKLRFRIRLYCDENFYSPACDVHCKAQDSEVGHYTCDAWTGKKVCKEGWRGQDCDRDVDECEEQVNVCHTGRCKNTRGRFTCVCPKGFTGQFCEILDDPCVAKPCQNGGECFSRQNTQDYMCVCPSGWKGHNCDEDVDECLSQAGLCHGGTCENWPGSFKCICPEGHSGQFCEIIGDPCTPNPCRNGGECFGQRDTQKFICMCRPGWQGDSCADDVDECVAHAGLCRSGTCENRPGSYKCVCQKGHTGQFCEILNDPCLASPCQNGGECFRQRNTQKYECVCRTGWEGEKCNIRRQNFCSGRNVCVNLDENSCTIWDYFDTYPYAEDRCKDLVSH